MALQAPVWRVKTRPCPFYQEGRCLFAESCNFLHTISVPNHTVATSEPLQLLPETPTKLPPVTIQPPSYVRSPPRSPRLSGLLLALKDVIGDDADDDYDYDALDEHTSINEPLARLDDSNVSKESTVVNLNHSPSIDINKSQGFDDSSGSTSIEDPEPLQSHNDETSRMSPSPNEPEGQPSIRTIQCSPHTEPPHTDPPETFNLLSPVDLSHLNLMPFLENAETTSYGEDFVDSGFVDTWKSPRPLAISPPRSPLKSTFGLLSSPFSTASSRVMSPRLSAFISRSPQSPFNLTSPIADDALSNLSLDSLNGDCPPEAEPTNIATGDTIEPASTSAETETGHNSDRDHDDEELAAERLTPPIWNGEEQPTAVYLGMPSLTSEIGSIIKRSSETPTHFLTKMVDFVDNEAIGHSSLADLSLSNSELSRPVSPAFSNDDAAEDEEFESTAQLAYLHSPAAPVNENDTLQSIYAEYSAFLADPEDTSECAPDVVPSQAREKQTSPVSTTITPGLLRERVFTPPPTREYAKTPTMPADSPVSIPSPPVSYGSLSQGRTSPHSLSGRSAWSPDSPISDQGVVESKKVPFGFRKSLALGSTNQSTLVSKRISKFGPREANRHPSTSSQSERAFSPEIISPTGSTTGGLRPLRLSTILGPKPSSASSRNSNFSINSSRQFGNTHRASISSTNVSSNHVLSNSLLYSRRSSIIPEHSQHTQDTVLSPSSSQSRRFTNFDDPHSAPLSQRPFRDSQFTDTIDSVQSRDWHDRRFSEPLFDYEEEDDDQEDTIYDRTIRRALPAVLDAAHIAPPVAAARAPVYSVAAPKPTLMFAIASDDVEQVRQALESGDAGPNDRVGPQSALSFALTNDQLSHKIDIIKTLLGYGADPGLLMENTQKSVLAHESRHSNGESLTPKSLTVAMDPATKYYLARADASHTRRTLALINRSTFRPLTRIRYEVIGQDRALEELFKVLGIHSRQLSMMPIVVLLCGPSGHGKSLLARKFGSLLDVPTHTVNMTTLNSTQDLWKSYSMSPYETSTTCTLAEFLINNEGKRCVVILDEIEKTRDEKTLWSLLMPWELGRCAFDANGRHVDVRNVIWLGTSNVGHDLVFEHHEARPHSGELMSREEYVELTGLLRPRVSERLGASILSRVTTVLPFVPFTLEERQAICCEALYSIAGDMVRMLSADAVESMVDGALGNYIAAEGARSLYRAVSNQLADHI